MWTQTTSMDLPSALQKLAAYRTKDTRASQDTFDNGLVVLKTNAVSKMGHESEPCHRHHGSTRLTL
jgi:hypothetical protein